jgi:hypothetical protein
MPVTARLSKAFYDQLGEQVANELVDWFNQVDLTYRTELRELNELNFARFDAKVEQRLGTLEARFDSRIDSLAAQLNAKLDAKLDRSVADHAFGQLNSKIEAQIAKLETRFERRLGEQGKWLIAGWTVLMASIAALWFKS